MIAPLRAAVAGAAAWLAVGITLAAADPGDAAAFSRVEVGIGGIYRTGSWTPLVLSAGGGSVAPDASGPPLHVWVEDPDGQLVRSPAGALSVSGTGASTARFCVRFGRPAAAVLLESRAADGPPRFTPLMLPPPLPSAETVLLVLGDLPAAARAARLLARDDGSRPRVVAMPDPRAVAADAPGMTPLDFDGIDAAIVCGSAVKAAASDELLRGVLTSLDGWVRRGGRLVFIAGTSAAELAAGKSSAEASPPARASPAAAWLPGLKGRPGRVERLVPLRRSAAIETYGRADRPLEKAAVAGLQVPLLADAGAIDGMIEAFEGTAPADLPLVVRSAHGFGTVTWIGLDIDQGSFRTWQGTDTLLAELLVGRAASQSWTGRAGDLQRDAIDLSGQLRLALDQFPGVAVIPFEIIAGLGILYVVCLYPLDWWLVTRGGRPWLAWLTLPVVVALFSGMAWNTARRWKGSDWQSSRADMTDIDVVSGLVRGFSAAAIWAPANTFIDVTIAPVEQAGITVVDSALSWFAAPGRGIGGTDATATHPSLAAGNYAFGGSLAALERIPIAAASSRIFAADWTGNCSGRPAPAAESPVVSSLVRETQGTLRGAIESRLTFPLEDCVLVHAGWLYDVGRFGPGDRFEPAAGRGPRSLAGALTRRTAFKDRDVPLRWDAEDRDIDRILEVAGFHAAAGGSSYTGSEAGRLGRLDLSPLLVLDRAVLVGRGPAGSAWQERHLQPDGSALASPLPASPNSGVWRIVLPLRGSQP